MSGSILFFIFYESGHILTYQIPLLISPRKSGLLFSCKLTNSASLVILTRFHEILCILLQHYVRKLLFISYVSSQCSVIITIQPHVYMTSSDINSNPFLLFSITLFLHVLPWLKHLHQIYHSSKPAAHIRDRHHVLHRRIPCYRSLLSTFAFSLTSSYQIHEPMFPEHSDCTDCRSYSHSSQLYLVWAGARYPTH